MIAPAQQGAKKPPLPPRRRADPEEAKRRQEYRDRWNELVGERSTWNAHHKKLAEQFCERVPRFGDSAANRSKENEKILNSTVITARRTLQSGMMAGITSPARPWFRLTTPDPDRSQSPDARAWLAIAEERIRVVFHRSNLYNALHTFYGDCSIFGTAPMHVDEDVDDIVRAYVYPVGAYALATSDRGAVDTVFREFQMTVKQLVQRFGLERCSSAVRDLWEKGNRQTWVKCLHVLEPNLQVELDRYDNAGKPYRSCWFELDAPDDTGFLHEGGYEELPTMAARWQVEGENVYGTGPGMVALGDSRALQQYERRKGQVIDKIVNPPMVVPSALRHARVSLLPGDITPVDLATGQKVEPAIVVPPQAMAVATEATSILEQRVNRAFFADLWLLIAQSDGDMTAHEVAVRQEEKMMQLGPVLERLQDELLDPLIERVFGILLRAGAIPPPPEELAGQPLRVEYISIIADAQKLLRIQAIERFAGFVGNVSKLNPDILDTFNVDAAATSYADGLGLPPELLHTKDEIAAARAERAKQAAAQQQGQAMLAAAQGAKDLAGASLEGDNGLTAMLGQMGAPVPPGGA